MKIFICGYYGFHNLGDEAILKALIESIRFQAPQAELTVLSASRHQTEEDYGVNAISRNDYKALMHAMKNQDFLVFGGGSLLQDVTSSRSILYYLGLMLLGKLHGKPIYMVAQGIGPIRRRLFRRMTRSMFRSASYISVRDRVSQQELESMGLPVDRIVLTTDPVWALPVDFLQATETVGSQAKAETVGSQAKAETVGSSQAENKSKRVLLSLRPWGSDPSLEDKWVDLIGRLQGELQVDVDILSFHRAQDTPLAERIASRAGCGWISHMDQPEAMLDRIGKADLLIGVRLHSLIFSALVETPFIGISYDPKVDAFVHAMEAGPVYSIESFSVTNLVEEAKMRLDDADFRKELQIKSRAMRDQASRDQKMMIQELLNE